MLFHLIQNVLFSSPQLNFSIIPRVAARETPRIIATFFISIYGDFLYLGDYTNINNYNISFYFCQYICLKFCLTHKKLSLQKHFHQKVLRCFCFHYSTSKYFCKLFSQAETKKDLAIFTNLSSCGIFCRKTPHRPEGK